MRGRRSRAGSARLRLLVVVGVLLATFLSVEGAASLFLSWYDSADSLTEESHCIFDPEIGWVSKRNIHLPDFYGEGRSLTVNAQGFRGHEEYEIEIPPGRRRIVCVGDSFTLGYGVDDAHTYPAELERADPRLQVINMGQGGYGIDQSYLWYLRDGIQLDADVVILSFIAPDFERALSARFQGIYAKPVLELEGGRLSESRDAVADDWGSSRLAWRLRRALEDSAASEFMNRLRRRRKMALQEGPEELVGPLPYREIGEALVSALAERCRARGSRLVLVHLPLPQGQYGWPKELVEWLGPFAKSLDIPFIDLAEPFAAMSPDDRSARYQPDRHLNSLGNRFVAAQLLEHLHPLLFPPE